MQYWFVFLNKGKHCDLMDQSHQVINETRLQNHVSYSMIHVIHNITVVCCESRGLLRAVQTKPMEMYLFTNFSVIFQQKGIIESQNEKEN